MQSELLTAIRAANLAGELLKRFFHQGITVDYKGEIDPVTPLDFQAESLITDVLARAFPGYGVLGEENHHEVQGSEGVLDCRPPGRHDQLHPWLPHVRGLDCPAEGAANRTGSCIQPNFG